jgi:hypothetical protein
MAEDLTRDRVELKYLALEDEVEDLLRQAGRFPEDPAFRTEQTRVTTVYFDLPDRILARRALERSRRALKVRLREYGPPSPFAWIEVKERNGWLSRKTRFPLAKGLVAPFFRGELEEKDLLEGAADRERLAEGLRQVRDVARGGPLLASGAACYRRLAIEGGHPYARLTIDLGISYHLGPLDLYEGISDLDRPALGPAALLEPGAVVEIKYRGGEPPRWCRRVVGDLPAVDFSKFLTLSSLALSEPVHPWGSTSKELTAAGSRRRGGA